MPDHLRGRLAELAAAFQQARPCVPASLALELWDAWRTTRPGQRFLQSEEQDVALLLHARAHGALVPEPGAKGYEGGLLRDRAGSFGPLVPPALPWGARANLAPEGGAALDAPVIRAPDIGRSFMQCVL